jgi:hypothetical protein
MTSIWKLNGADIYVDNDQVESEAIVAELQPIDASASIFHYIMTPSPTKTIEGTVIGSGYLDTIKSGVGSNVTLISDLEPGGITVTLVSVSEERQLVYAQRVDDSLPETAPVYRVSCVVRP